MHTAVLLFLCGVAGAPRPTPPVVTITDDGLHFGKPYKPDARYGKRLFWFAGGGPQRYAISLTLRQSKSPDGTWKTGYSFVGMPRPCEANWYHSGFFGLSANGPGIQNHDPEVEVVETGRRGMLDFTWRHVLVVVRARIIAEPASNRLLMELRWEPTPGLKRLEIGLVCYPQGYRPSERDRLNGKKLDRHMVTAVRDVGQVKTVKLDLPTEWWQLYQDNTLERSPTYRPGGPCALALRPEDVNGAEVKITGYPVQIKVDLRVPARQARFALWDFSGTSAVKAKQILIDRAPALRDQMRSGDWLPTSVRTFDPATERRRADGLGAQDSARVTRLRKEIDRLADLRGALPDATQPLRAERELRNAITAYRTLFWQVERPTRKTVRTLVLAGLFAYAWKVEPVARSAWGPDAVRRGAYVWKYWAGHRITYFPSTTEELLSYDVVVLADIPQDPLTADNRRRLAEFVTLGGGLLLLGGPYAYGGAGWAGSPLEPLLPVSIGRTFDMRPAGPDARPVLTPVGRKRLGPVGTSLGVVPWRNEVAVRAGARVWLTAGGKPLAVFRRAGEGRALAVLGTAVGQAPRGSCAFYDSPGWPTLLKRMLSYLACGK